MKRASLKALNPFLVKSQPLYLYFVNDRPYIHVFAPSLSTSLCPSFANANEVPVQEGK